MKRYDIFSHAPGISAMEEEMAKYAIDQEYKMGDFYLYFENAFPDEWKMMNFQTLADAERAHANKLISM